MRHSTRTLGADIDCKLVERNAGSDRVQLLVTYPPTLAIAELFQRLKRSTGQAVRREFVCRRVHPCTRGHPWLLSYFAVSFSGAILSIIKQYVIGQARRRTGWANPGLQCEAHAQDTLDH